MTIITDYLTPDPAPFWRRAGLQVQLNWSPWVRPGEPAREWFIDVVVRRKETRRKLVNGRWYVLRWWYWGEVSLLGFRLGASGMYMSKPILSPEAAS